MLKTQKDTSKSVINVFNMAYTYFFENLKFMLIKPLIYVTPLLLFLSHKVPSSVRTYNYKKYS